MLRLCSNLTATRFRFLINISEVFTQNESCSVYLVGSRNHSMLRDALKVDAPSNSQVVWFRGKILHPRETYSP